MAVGDQFVSAVEPSKEASGVEMEKPRPSFDIEHQDDEHTKRKISRENTKTPERALDEQRHGTWVHGVGHIITAVIGSGVLYLPYFWDTLGWVGGIIMTLLFGWITWYTSRLLADAMVINGVRYRTYQSAVKACFGNIGGIVLACVQYPNLILTAIAYNITGANSMKSFAMTYQSFTNTALCTEEAVDDVTGEPTGYCATTKIWVFCIVFAGAQLFLSQIPNLDSAALISFLGALMSFGYSLITLVMSIYEIAHFGASSDTSASGYPVQEGYSTADKVFGVFNAFGGIVFAFSFSFILIEISDTLRDTGRGAVWHMKRAVTVSLIIISTFYFLVSILGYIAYGDRLFDSPYVIDLWFNPDSTGTTNVARAANIMVLVHMLPAYQVFSQPVFAEVERVVRDRGPTKLATLSKWTFRIFFRSFYVVCVGVIAACLPFFSDFVGLIGALGFWPATVFFPIEMYRHIHGKTIREAWGLELLNVFCFLVTICATIGSVQLIVVDASNYKVFG